LQINNRVSQDGAYRIDTGWIRSMLQYLSNRDDGHTRPAAA